jgi:hypothetical protein
VDGQIVGYMQKQLGMRGYYVGPADGRANPRFLAAVAQSRADLGLEGGQAIDLFYFSAFLNSSRRAVAPVAATSNAPVLQIAASGGARKFERGTLVSLAVTSSSDAHLYCYLQDENRKIQRFFPNRFATDSLVRAAAPVEFPGKMRFQLVANEKGITETVACFTTGSDVMKDLPANVTGTDFENLPVDSLEQIKSAFTAVNGASVGQAYFNIETR